MQGYRSEKENRNRIDFIRLSNTAQFIHFSKWFLKKLSISNRINAVPTVTFNKKKISAIFHEDEEMNRSHIRICESRQKVLF